MAKKRGYFGFAAFYLTSLSCFISVYLSLSQLYLSLSQLHLGSRLYLSIEIWLSPPHFALTHGYPTAIARLSHGYLTAISRLSRYLPAVLPRTQKRHPPLVTPPAGAFATPLPCRHRFFWAVCCRCVAAGLAHVTTSPHHDDAAPITPRRRPGRRGGRRVFRVFRVRELAGRSGSSSKTPPLNPPRR